MTHARPRTPASPTSTAIGGAQRIDALFVGHLRAADAALAGRFAAARAAARCTGAQGGGGAADRRRAAPGGLPGAAVRHRRGGPARSRPRHHELAPLFAVKRQFVQRKAMNAYKADVAATFDGPALRAALEARLGAQLAGTAGELAFALAVTALAAGRSRACRRSRRSPPAMPRGRCTRRRAVLPPGGVLFRAPRKLDYMKLVPLEAGPQRRRRLEAAGGPPAPARRLRADRRRDRPGRRARPGALLHLVPRAGQGHLRARAAREEGRRRRRPFKKRRSA